MPPKLFSFTLLSKNAPASHLESRSCKNKGLKVPCFYTLTKKGVGEGGPLPHQPHLRHCPRRAANQQSLFVTRLTSTLTKNASATPLTSTLTKTTIRSGMAVPSEHRESRDLRPDLTALTSTLTNFASATPLTSTLTKTKDLKRDYNLDARSVK